LLTRYRVISANFFVASRGYTADGFDDLAFMWRDKSRYVGGHGRFCDHRSSADHASIAVVSCVAPFIAASSNFHLSMNIIFETMRGTLLERNSSSREACVPVAVCFNTRPYK